MSTGRSALVILTTAAAAPTCTRRFECNYGVPFPIDFDRMFGTWVDYKEFKANGGKMPQHVRDSMAARRGKKTTEVDE